MKAIIAMSEGNRVIGKANKIPWYEKEDLKFFKEKTWGHPLIIGRKTYEGLGVPYLNQRGIFVLTKQSYGWDNLHYADPRRNVYGEVNIISDPSELPDRNDYWVCGGLSIYQLFLPKITEFYVTYIRQDYGGDTVMPPFEDGFAKSEVVLEKPNFVIKRLYDKVQKSSS
jgi:dihydrofolate reductase